MTEPGGCVDLCVSCSSAVKTFANLQVVRDEKHLAPTWMPPGGCTCKSMELDPSCQRCFPSRTLCQPCGETTPDLSTSPETRADQ